MVTVTLYEYSTGDRAKHIWKSFSEKLGFADNKSRVKAVVRNFSESLGFKDGFSKIPAVAKILYAYAIGSSWVSGVAITLKGYSSSAINYVANLRLVEYASEGYSYIVNLILKAYSDAQQRANNLVYLYEYSSAIMAKGITKIFHEVLGFADKTHKTLKRLGHILGKWRNREHPIQDVSKE